MSGASEHRIVQGDAAEHGNGAAGCTGAEHRSVAAEQQSSRGAQHHSEGLTGEASEQ